MSKRPASSLQSPEFVGDYILENIKSPYKLYQWEYDYITKGRKQYRSALKSILIEVSTIISTAFIVPMFTEKKTKPICAHPRYTDLFWYIDRKFFDRSGWDDIHYQGINTADTIRDLDPIVLSELYGYVDTDSDYSANDSPSSDSEDSI